MSGYRGNMQNQLFDFFFGTPRRLRATVIGLVVVLAVVCPNVVGWAINRVLLAISPVIVPALIFVPIWLAIRKILGLGGKKK